MRLLSQFKVSLIDIKIAVFVGATFFLILFGIDRYIQTRFLDSAPKYIQFGKELILKKENERDSSPGFIELKNSPDGLDSWASFFTSLSSGFLLFDVNGDRFSDILIFDDNTSASIKVHDFDGGNREKPKRYLRLFLWNPTKNNFQEVREGELEGSEKLIVNPKRGFNHKVNVAASADFNGDGLLDLFIGFGVEGSFLSLDKNSSTLPQEVGPVDQMIYQSQLELVSPIYSFFPKYLPKNNLHLKNGGGENLILINLGDKNRNGFPEWSVQGDEIGIKGSRNTYSVSVADIDLDGDIDIYEGNNVDMDLWTSGSKKWSGALNRLYLNQVAQTGEMRFIEASEAYGVSRAITSQDPIPKMHRLFKVPIFSEELSYLLGKKVTFEPELMSYTDISSEKGRITWTTSLIDLNNDFYPDLIVAHDLGFPAVYINQNGERFQRIKPGFSKKIATWKTISEGDFNLDGNIDSFLGNMGCIDPNVFFNKNDLSTLFDPDIEESYVLGEVERRHTFWNWSGKNRFFNRIKTDFPGVGQLIEGKGGRRSVNISDSECLGSGLESINQFGSITASTVLDFDNDEKEDLFVMGNMYGLGANGRFNLKTPAHLLRNTSSPGDSHITFEDVTTKSGVHNFVKGRNDSQSKNVDRGFRVVSRWDQVGENGEVGFPTRYFYDELVGVDVGRSVSAIDINNDGYSDLVVRNLGSFYNPTSVEKTWSVDGSSYFLPDVGYFGQKIRNFAPGPTRVFISKGGRNNWIKIELKNNNSMNRFGIGAKVVVNDRLVKIVRATQGDFGANKFEPLIFGLGKNKLYSLKIIWPEKVISPQEITFKNGVKNRILIVDRVKGVNFEL